jgi:hypothetical protein
MPLGAATAARGHRIRRAIRILFGEAIAYFLPTGSTTFVDREEDGQRNGPDRLHRVHVYMSRRTNEDAKQWIYDTECDLASLDVIQKWKLHLPEPSGATLP